MCHFQAKKLEEKFRGGATQFPATLAPQTWEWTCAYGCTPTAKVLGTVCCHYNHLKCALVVAAVVVTMHPARIIYPVLSALRDFFSALEIIW